MEPNIISMKILYSDIRQMLQWKQNMSSLNRMHFFTKTSRDEETLMLQRNKQVRKAKTFDYRIPGEKTEELQIKDWQHLPDHLEKQRTQGLPVKLVKTFMN